MATGYLVRLRRILSNYNMVQWCAQCKVSLHFNVFKEDLINFTIIIEIMKKRSISKSFLVIAVLAISFVSCKADRTREDKVAAIIDKVDSPFLVINAVPGDLIEKSGALDGALPFTQEMLLSFFIDEEVTGVDYDTDIQIVIGKGPSFAPNFYGIFKLKNEAAFIELLEVEANGEIKEKDGFKYIAKESDQYVIVWNEEFVIASNIPIDLAAMMSGGSSNSGMKAVDASIALISAAEDGEVNEDYKTFLQNESDIALHFSGAGFYEYMVEMSMGEVEELEANRENIEGVNTDMFLNFNDGSINMQFLSDLSDKVKEEMGFLKDSQVDSKLLSYGNSSEPIMTMVYNTEFEKALDYIKEQTPSHEYEEFEEEASEMGISIEDVKSALTGEILIVIDRVEIVEEEIDWGYGEPYISKVPTPIFAIVLSVSDESLLTQMLSASDTVMDGVVKNGDAYMVMNDNILFSTNDSLWAAKVVENNTVQINDAAGVLSSEPIGVFVDFLSLAKMDDLDDAAIFVEMLKDARASGDMSEFNFSFTFKDASKNALRILTETIANLGNGNGNEEYDALEAELEAAAESTEAVDDSF